MNFEEQEKLALKIRQTVISATEASGLKASFAKGRRQSDMLIIKLSGKREHAYAISNHLVITFPEIDIDILKVKSQNTFYPFILVISQKLDEQSMAFNERRSKLISKFNELEKNLQSLNQKFPPPNFNDTIFLENF